MSTAGKGSGGFRPFFLLLGILAACSIGCGKKGPPLPPLVRLPEAPSGVVAERRASVVDVQLTIPASNTDGTRPANVSRVDVYAVTGPPSLSDEELLRYGTRIGSLEVKTPRNSDDAVDAEDTDTEIEPPEGPGLDQGLTVHVEETLGGVTSAPAQRDVSRTGDALDTGPEPLVGPPADVPSRTYAAVGVSPNGRRGPLSQRAVVPLIAPPAAVARPDVRYDETSLTVTWTPVGWPRPVPEALEDPSAELLTSRPLVEATGPTLAYHVYDGKDAGMKLTSSPVSEGLFVDSRLEWGVERCYTVRTVEMVAGLTLEGEAAEVRCVTPVDTFPPAVPKGLELVPNQSAINLIWDANGEKDLAGYIVLRGASSDALTPVTTPPIQAPTFRDVVPAGFHGFYAVQAIDTAGNVSAASSVMDETAR